MEWAVESVEAVAGIHRQTHTHTRALTHSDTYTHAYTHTDTHTTHTHTHKPSRYSMESLGSGLSALPTATASGIIHFQCTDSCY